MKVTLTEIGANHFNQKYNLNHQSEKVFKEGASIRLTDNRLWRCGGAGILWLAYDDKYIYNPLHKTAFLDTAKSIDKEYIRKNKGKTKLSYSLMFPHAMKELCDRMTENEDKYPNDRFSEYIPEETVESLLRHLSDVKAPVAVHDSTESKREALTAVLFNALCLLESSIVQGHEWAKEKT